MAISDRQRRLLFAAVRHLEMTEDEFRHTLAMVAEVTSVRELDQEGFDAVMGCFERLGFAPGVPEGSSFGSEKARPGMATSGQVQFIRVLWREYTRYRSGDRDLDKWLLNKWQVSSLRFLTKADAQKAITALLAMKKRRRSA